MKEKSEVWRLREPVTTWFPRGRQTIGKRNETEGVEFTAQISITVRITFILSKKIRIFGNTKNRHQDADDEFFFYQKRRELHYFTQCHSVTNT